MELPHTRSRLKSADYLDAKLWLADGCERMVRAAEREGDSRALTCCATITTPQRRSNFTSLLKLLDADVHAAGNGRCFSRIKSCRRHAGVGRTAVRKSYSTPVTMRRFARVWRAQMPQSAAVTWGLPGLTVSTGPGRSVAGRRADRLCALSRDLCLAAGEASRLGMPASRSIR